jgi:hypothetical protein
VLQLLDRVDARCLQQLGIFLADAGNPHQVGHVGPFQQPGFIEPRLLGHFGPPLFRTATAQQSVRIGNTRALELFTIGGADSFDLFDLVLHRKCPHSKSMPLTRNPIAVLPGAQTIL